MLGLIWVQIALQADGIPERIFSKKSDNKIAWKN